MTFEIITVNALSINKIKKSTIKGHSDKSDLFVLTVVCKAGGLTKHY